LQLSVPAISCAHCVAAITGEVGKVAGVSTVDVDLVTKLVTVRGENLERSTIVGAIDDAGYDVA
jgi:copper ion binding protein